MKKPKNRFSKHLRDALASQAPIVHKIITPSTHYLDQVMVRLPCFEPNSHTIELTGEDLTRNILIVGSVGSGKTTGPIHRIVNDAIRFKADDAQQKLSLVIFDLKGDRTLDAIQAFATEAGRGKDVLVLGGDSSLRLPLFSQLQEFEDIQPFVDSLQIASERMTGENAFWEQSRVTFMRAFLALLMASSQSMSMKLTLRWLHYLMNRDFLSQGQIKREYELRKKVLENLVGRTDLEEGLGIFLANCLDHVKCWEQLDPRSHSTHLSCIQLLLAPFTDLHSARFVAGGLGEQKHLYFPAQYLDIHSVINEGKILVVSIPAAIYPKQAALVSKMVKSMLYSAIAARSPQKNDPDRLVLLVMDEYPLVATGNDPKFGDVEMLATARSRRMGVVAATQGLINVQQAIGEGPMKCLLCNFNAQIFMKCNDPLTNDYAYQHLGVKTLTRRRRVEDNPNAYDPWPFHPQPPGTNYVEQTVPVCPLGTLSRLETYQAFVHGVAQGFTPDLVQFEPLYPNLPPAPKTKAKSQVSRRSLVTQAQLSIQRSRQDPSNLSDNDPPLPPDLP